MNKPDGESKGRIFIKTFGCQMNMYDSQYLRSVLIEKGFTAVEEAEEAETIIVNGCSIRKHAEERAINWIHKFSKLGNRKIAVTGCLAQNLHDKLHDIVEGIDIICGPDNYMELVDILESSEGGVTLDGNNPEATYSLAGGHNPGRYSGFVSITRGCENFCSYCVVPYLRGKLRSKNPEAVIAEINMLAEKGLREVTLLGQNVIAYDYQGLRFTQLLKLVLEKTTIERLRFLTSHPRDVEDDLFLIIKENLRVCPHIHLPIQSGSDRILNLMNRGYTSDDYLSIIESARRLVPDIAFSTDIIVGFPSETDDDFARTLDLVRKARFDSAFTFAYSAREGTAAWRFPDNVVREKKKARLNRLNQLVNEIRLNILEKEIGKSFKILLDGTVQRGENRYFKGRTPHFRNVLLDCNEAREGDIIDVTLEKLENYTFIGKYGR